MLRILVPATLLAALLASPPAPASPAADPGGAASVRALPAGAAAPAQDAVPGELLVRFKGNAGGSERAQARRSARVDFARDMRVADSQVVKTEPGQSESDALAALRRNGAVKHATRNWIVRAAATPNDTRYAGELWGLHNTGQSIQNVTGVADADIDAPEAWDLFKDATNTVVAVADTGVRYDHPDLDGNIWSNPQETLNGADEAGDPGTLVDDVRGWDFIDNDNDPTDLAEHGTHVAGTIAAEGNNGLGITGVAWDAQIMPIRVLDEDGSGTGEAIVNGFAYAGQMGAKVLNASLGGPGDAGGIAFYNDLFDDYPNTLYVVAAGNEGQNNETTISLPCNATVANVVCVAATNNQDALASFSNYGTTAVDLAAPGVGTMSTVPKVATTGFADSFDDAGIDGWVAGGTGGTWQRWTDATNFPDTGGFLGESPTDTTFQFDNFEDIWARTASPYNLAGKSGCVLGYDIYHDYDPGVDGLLVETSSSTTGPWTSRDGYTGNNGGIRRRHTNLKADGQSVYVRFRTAADNTIGSKSSYYGALIDNVAVTCAATPDATSYQFFQGTSMATPHVAGVATLLFGAKPSASVAQVRGWLLNSGDQLAALNAKTATGRRLNALKALQAAGVSQPVTPPEAVTGAASNITQTTATLNGTVDPNGTETTYKFVYGTAANALTSQVPLTPASAGAGTAPVAVSQPLTGLSAGTTYFYRLVAIQGATETPGSTQSFQTATVGGGLAPAVTMAAASAVGATTATLVGTVNPNGKATTFHWEYGTSAGNLNAQTPTLSAGNGSSVVDLRSGIADLQPNTTYHYRLRATNADGSAGGATTPLTFTTGALPAGPQGPQGPAGTNGTNGTNGAPGAPGAAGTNGTNGTNGAAGTAGPAGPAGPQGPAGAPGAKGLVTCKVTGKTTKPKVKCTVSHSTAAKASVRISRAGRLVARGSAKRMRKGRALRMTTLRRVGSGRYRLQVTLVERGVKTTLTSTIRL